MKQNLPKNSTSKNKTKKFDLERWTIRMCALAMASGLYLTVKAKEEDKKGRLNTVLYNLIESITMGASLLEPFMPDTSASILKQLGVEKRTVTEMGQFGLYPNGNKVTSEPEILFARIDTDAMLDEIEKESLLPKQLTSANGVIPYQVHLKELRTILSNAEQYLPFLKEKDESGLTNSEKIQQLFSFQIPYYIGPLYNDGNASHNAWVFRKESGKVYPWNFEQKIDVKASSEEFIRRLVRRCTYLTSENVLPKSSLLYQKFMVLNELNNLKINGVPIDTELKQDIYRDLFCRDKKVTSKKIKEYLITRGVCSKKTGVEISGIDGDFKSSLGSYILFCEIFKVSALTYEQEKMAEQIIFWATVYGDTKSFLKEKIEENFGDILSAAQIKRICGIKFKDWGRLSKAMLELEGADRETGEVLTIISRMWNENVNLMECLSDKYTWTKSPTCRR